MFAEHGIRVIGVDITEEMLVLGQQKAVEKGLDDLVDFVVGDAEAPPVREASFHACTMLGALHHMSDPGKVFAAAAQKLAPPGYFFSAHPHDSPLRFLFDWLMKIWRIYDEQARDDPLFSEEDLLGWMDAAGLEGQTRLTIYLPPHCFGFCSVPAALKLLRVTNVLFGALPCIRRWAGYVIAEGNLKGGAEVLDASRQEGEDA
jgi:SAM-dependent methyltransferase